MTLPLPGRTAAAWPHRHPWVVLTVWSVCWSLVFVTDHGRSWHFLETGSQALFSPDGLALYVQHPELQMGPLTFVLGGPFADLLSGRLGEAVGLAFIFAIGLLVLRELRAVPRIRTERSDRVWFAAALLVVPVWAELAVHWGHLDDAMALWCALLGLRMVRSGRPVLSAVFLGLAVDFKPWAVPFVALLIIAPRRRWPMAAAVWAAVIAAAWVPFVVAFPETLHVASFAIPIDPASTLHLFGVTDGTPAWCRYAQVLGGTALAVIAVARNRYASVLMVVIALRILLDPAAKTYYEAGLLVGTAVFDIALGAWLLPLATIAAFLTVYLPSTATVDATACAVIRTLGLLALVGAGLLFPRRPTSDDGYDAMAPPSHGPSSALDVQPIDSSG